MFEFVLCVFCVSLRQLPNYTAKLSAEKLGFLIWYMGGHNSVRVIIVSLISY